MEMINIYRPIKTDVRTQHFGENLACIAVNPPQGAMNAPRVLGKDAQGLCPKGYRDFYRVVLGMKAHNGSDHAVWHGEHCYFSTVIEGMEWFAKNEIDGAGGIGVDIISKTPLDIDGKQSHIKFRFWHLESSNVYDGEEVEVGDMIGRCDNTGASGGDHLHFSMKLCDAEGKGMYTDNGYRGAINHEPFEANTFVLDKINLKGQPLSFNDWVAKLTFILKRILWT